MRMRGMMRMTIMKRMHGDDEDDDNEEDGDDEDDDNEEDDNALYPPSVGAHRTTRRRGRTSRSCSATTAPFSGWTLRGVRQR